MKKNLSFCFFLFCLLQISFLAEGSLPENKKNKSLTVHLFCEANGKGLEKDRNILEAELLYLNCDVTCFDSQTKEAIPFADINIFVQAINSNYLNSAERNWFIPNPEWFLDDLQILTHIDLVLCKTKEAEKIFNRLKCPTYFLGFTSEDHYYSKFKRNPNFYFHLAGSNSQKGTKAIKAVWKKNIHFPFLTLLNRSHHPLKLKNFKNITHYIPETELLQFQNEAMVHLCPSETEGFGHYIMEAMSVGAVVITTNAPPMNEFISDPRFLVSYNQTKKQQLAINYYVDELDLARKIWNLQKISKMELKAAGAANRIRYLQLTQQFRKNLRVLIESLL